MPQKVLAAHRGSFGIWRRWSCRKIGRSLYHRDCQGHHQGSTGTARSRSHSDTRTRQIRRVEIHRWIGLILSLLDLLASPITTPHSIPHSFASFVAIRFPFVSFLITSLDFLKNIWVSNDLLVLSLASCIIHRLLIAPMRFSQLYSNWRIFP